MDTVAKFIHFGGILVQSCLWRNSPLKDKEPKLIVYQKQFNWLNTWGLKVKYKVCDERLKGWWMVVVVVTLSLLASALSLVVVVGRCSRGWRSRGYVSLQVFPIILSILSHPLHLSQSYCGCSLSFYQKLFMFTQKKGFLFMAKDCLVWPKGIYVSQNVPNIWPNLY